MHVIPLRNAQHPLAENTPPPPIYPQHRANIDVFIIEDTPLALLKRTILLIRCCCTSIGEKGAQGAGGESGSVASFMTWGLQPASTGTAGDAELLLDKGRGERRRAIMQLCRFSLLTPQILPLPSARALCPPVAYSASLDPQRSHMLRSRLSWRLPHGWWIGRLFD